jgi:2-keto-4-pentenoate hydratase/2-oxohepta-3-ene-1,7-dioic acid hydratase in catechol pathway
MIFTVAEVVSYLSRTQTLMPGDIIMTSTPAGVILGYPEDEREWLKDSDEVTVEITGLGSLKNSVEAPVRAKWSD